MSVLWKGPRFAFKLNKIFHRNKIFFPGSHTYLWKKELLHAEEIADGHTIMNQIIIAFLIFDISRVKDLEVCFGASLVLN